MGSLRDDGPTEVYAQAEMTDLLLGNEPVVRLTVFLGVLLAMMIGEIAAPRRRLEIPRVIRWSNNLALVVIDTTILRLSFPLLAVGLAALAQEKGWGLFNTFDLPVSLSFRRLGLDPRPGDLPSACGVSRRARAVAFTPDAPCRPRCRRHDWAALPSC